VETGERLDKFENRSNFDRCWAKNPQLQSAELVR
jgi:hypothetical protein